MRSPSVESISNVCLIVASVAVTVAVGRNFRAQPTSATPSSTRSEYAQAERLPALDGVQYSATPKTLLLVISSHCKYCEESAPFYQTLVDDHDRLKVQVIAVGTEPRSTLADWLDRNRVRVDGVVSVPPGTLKVAGTPTVILADKDGRVSEYWKGALRDRERDVIAAVNR